MQIEYRYADQNTWHSVSGTLTEILADLKIGYVTYFRMRKRIPRKYNYTFPALIRSGRVIRNAITVKEVN